MDTIKSVRIDEAAYPGHLKNIDKAPSTLYYRGVLPNADEPLFAVVGTRRPSPYGKQATFDIAGSLAGAGVIIVSGMAPGIDSFAHQAVVEKKKRTIAVLGTGIDEPSIYPKNNITLAREIVKYGGCVMSELAPGTPGSTFSFPKRNRIVAGLASGVLVIEAKLKSGSLITADYATKQNKKVFAVPGSIYSLNSQGPNMLIKTGATAIQSADNILKALGFEQKTKVEETIADNNEEQLILQALMEDSLPVDRIIEKTKMSASLVAATLALMEVEGKVRNLGGNIYGLNKN